MVPRGAHRAEGGIALTPVEALDGVGTRTRRLQRRPPGTGAGARVGVQPTAAGPAEAFELIEVLWRMQELELGSRRRSRRHREQGVVDASPPGPDQHCVETGRSLGMPRARVVLRETSGGDEEDGQGDERTEGPATPPIAFVVVHRLDVLRRGHERARVGPWRGDHSVAYLLPIAERPPLTAAMVRHCCAVLVERGYDEVVTGALAPPEQRSFLDAGFAVREELDLLGHDLHVLPDDGAAPLRRGRRRDRNQVLAVDSLAFPQFWRLDANSLDEALAATPAVRFRVALDDGSHQIVGYAVSGRAGPRGYIQRLAVAPGAQRRGIGRDLLIDGLRWLRRRGAARAVVNTQVDNERAHTLYLSLGFRQQSPGLAVLGRRLEDRQLAG